MSATQRNCATCAFPLTAKRRWCTESAGYPLWTPRTAGTTGGADAPAAAQTAPGAANGQPWSPDSHLGARSECVHQRGEQRARARAVAPQAATLNEQPAPVANNHPAVWGLVMADMQSRDALGLSKYGVRLQPHNGRDFLLDAYAEVLDMAVYLRGAIYERDGK